MRGSLLCFALSVASLSPALAACGSSGSSNGAADSGASGGEDGAPDDGGGEGGTGPTTCISGLVRFELHAGPGAPDYCLGPPGACNGAQWLSILPADGGAELNQVMGCVPDCYDCQPVECTNVCAATPPLGDAGAQTSWNGTYLEQATCGASVSCTRDRCAPAGDYIARMCGYAESSGSGSFVCQGSPTPTCVDVPFVWPPAAGPTPTLVATLGGPADAGAGD